MSDDIFARAGEDFRNQTARGISQSDQALARLEEIAALAESGISAFYKAIGNGASDVYVERPTERQVNIRYGVRPIPRSGRIVNGPLAIIFVAPNGTTLLARDMAWRETLPGNGTMESSPLSENQDWRPVVSEWIVAFLRESETLFQNHFV